MSKFPPSLDKYMDDHQGHSLTFTLESISPMETRIGKKSGKSYNCCFYSLQAPDGTIVTKMVFESDDMKIQGRKGDRFRCEKDHGEPYASIYKL